MENYEITEKTLSTNINGRSILSGFGPGGGSGMKRRKKMSLWFAAVLIIFLATLCFGCSNKYVAVENMPENDAGKNWPYKRFTKEAWANSTINNRYIYYYNLRDRKILNNLSKNEIMELLGEPAYNSMDEIEDYVTYFIKFVDDDETDINDYYAIYIHFDEGRVTNYYVYGD